MESDLNKQLVKLFVEEALEVSRRYLECVKILVDLSPRINKCSSQSISLQEERNKEIRTLREHIDFFVSMSAEYRNNIENLFKNLDELRTSFSDAVSENQNIHKELHIVKKENEKLKFYNEKLILNAGIQPSNIQQPEKGIEWSLPDLQSQFENLIIAHNQLKQLYLASLKVNAELRK